MNALAVAQVELEWLGEADSVYRAVRLEEEDKEVLPVRCAVMLEEEVGEALPKGEGDGGRGQKVISDDATTPEHDPKAYRPLKVET